jgi:hypothetical protein
LCARVQPSTFSSTQGRRLPAGAGGWAMGAGHGSNPWRATQLLALALAALFATGVLLGQAGYGPKQAPAPTALATPTPVSSR